MKKITIDFDKGTVTANDKETRSLNDPVGFRLVSEAWLRAGWDSKYVYSFTWLGRPVIQLPDDLIRIQEVIYSLKPDYIVETGIAHGGSLIFYASLCKLIGKGKIIGVDIEIRPHNRKAIEEHELYSKITLIEGNSVDIKTVNEVKKHIDLKANPTILVILDSNHTKEHVLKELYLYSPFVSAGSYIIAGDGGIKELVVGGPRTESDWSWNNPKQAAIEFVKNNPNFIIEEPKIAFNEGTTNNWISYWSGGFIKRVK